MNIDQVVHIENCPKNYHAVYPFSITVHVPGSHPLTVAELAKLKDAVVNVASKIREMRGGYGWNFGWSKAGVIDWEDSYSNAHPSAIADAVWEGGE